MTEPNGHTESFEDAIRAHLIENRQTLVQAAVGQAIERMAESMKWTAMTTAQGQLEEFFKTEVAPEIEKYLHQNREAIIANVIGALRQITDGALKLHAEDMLKNLSQSYHRDKLLSALLGKTY
jgi:hypothetical protein